MTEPVAPGLELLARVRADVGEPLTIGPTSAGVRRVVPILGGTVEGERLRGEVLPGGADWQLVEPDGTGRLEARYIVRTHDGALIYVRNLGLRTGPAEVLARIADGEIVDPAEYHFRSIPGFECGDPRYEWLNRVLAVGSGARLPGAVAIDLYAVT
jgi:hypothetical protein